MIINKCFNSIYYSNHSILFSNVIFVFLLNTYMYSSFFKLLKGIVRVLPLFLRSNLNRDISLFLHSDWNSDISIEKPGVRVVILTSGYLDYFSVFELLIQTSKNYIAINHNIDQILWDDLRVLDADMRQIINRLQGLSDPYVTQTLLNMEAAMDYVMTVKSSSPNVNGLPCYTFKYMDLYISTLRVEFLGYLVPYMSEQEVQCFNVTRDTMVTVKSDFNQYYMDKVEASQILSNLNHSKLMMEVRWLLLNKPFNP